MLRSIVCNKRDFVIVYLKIMHAFRKEKKETEKSLQKKIQQRMAIFTLAPA